MDWDQIKSKWAAMTCRVCGDLPINTVETTGKIQRRVVKAEAKTSIGADQQVAAGSDEQTMMTAQ